MHGKRAEQGGHTENQRNVGDVGSVGVAQRQAGIALAGGDGRDHHLGCGGAETDDHHADEERGSVEVPGGCRRP